MGTAMTLEELLRHSRDVAAKMFPGVGILMIGVEYDEDSSQREVTLMTNMSESEVVDVTCLIPECAFDEDPIDTFGTQARDDFGEQTTNWLQ